MRKIFQQPMICEICPSTILELKKQIRIFLKNKCKNTDNKVTLHNLFIYK